MANKIPAIQFYPGDWRKDPGVQSLSYHDRGVWFEILCLMHESEHRGLLLLNGAAMPNGALARLLGLPEKSAAKTVSTLLEYGVASRDEVTGALMCRRMVRDEEFRRIRAEGGEAGASFGPLGGGFGSRGGRPRKTPLKTPLDGSEKPPLKPPPSSSSSSSSSEGGLYQRGGEHESLEQPARATPPDRPPGNGSEPVTLSVLESKRPQPRNGNGQQFSYPEFPQVVEIVDRWNSHPELKPQPSLHGVERVIRDALRSDVTAAQILTAIDRYAQIRGDPARFWSGPNYSLQAIVEKRLPDLLAETWEADHLTREAKRQHEEDAKWKALETA